MKRLVLLPLIFTTACLGGPAFTVGEAPDGGPLLAELAPDVFMAEDGGVIDTPDADPPDALATKGDAQYDVNAESEDAMSNSTYEDGKALQETGSLEAALPPPPDAGCAMICHFIEDGVTYDSTEGHYTCNGMTIEPGTPPSSDCGPGSACEDVYVTGATFPGTIECE
jgi:hypothetical protein